MPKTNYKGGVSSSKSMHSTPKMRIVGDTTKFMSTGNRKASVGNVTYKGKK